MDIPAPGLGTGRLRGEAGRRVVAEAAAMGWPLYDTAQMYGNEAEVGAGLRDAGVARASVYVVTKIHQDRFVDGSAFASAEESVERIGLGPVDLLLCHWPPRGVPVAKVMEVLNRCREQGLAKAVGVSNFNRAEMRVAAAEGPVAANEVEYHPLIDQRALKAGADGLEIRRIGYRAIGRGRVIAEPAVKAVAAQHGVEPAAVAIAWAMAKGVVPLCNTTRSERLGANWAAAGLALSEQDIAEIDGLQAQDLRLCDPGWQSDWNG
jgi:2,5-diketo-D-gluconate reductase B